MPRAGPAAAGLPPAAGERAEMGDRWFRQEYMCEFVDVAGGVFDGETIERAMSDDIEPLRL